MSTLTAERIAQNLAAVRARLDDAIARAGREPGSVRLVAVTKYVGVPETQAVLAAGARDLAENRVEKAGPKIDAIGREAARWHMVGHVQRRKARDVAAYFDTCDAVDRVELAEALQRRCAQQDTTLDTLIELNIAGEEQKHGLAPQELEGALRAMQAFDRLRVRGVMTMAPYGAPEPALRQVFRTLRELADAHGLPECSMGMTDDFEIAVEEGSTEVRIGRALYEA